VTKAVAVLREQGYLLVRRGGPPVLVELLEQLGRVLHVEEVVATTDAQSLVKSADGLSLHTDHHSADLIAWLCIAQTDEGGETILADAVAAYLALEPTHQRALERVNLQEHSVFATDTNHHPVVTFRRGEPRIYYSYWLSDEHLAAPERAAFEAFAEAVTHQTLHRFLLRPGDILVVDNGRMLHGRTSINGNRARHLRRYWIEADAGVSAP